MNRKIRSKAIFGIVIGVVILAVGILMVRIRSQPTPTSADQFEIRNLNEMPWSMVKEPPPEYGVVRFTGKETHVVIPSQVAVEMSTASWLGGRFQRWTGIKTYKTHRPIVRIEDAAFWKSSIESVVIPEGITRIGGKRLFRLCQSETR